MEVTVIIPARYAASRFPGKVLADLAGRPIIQHVYSRAAAAEKVDKVLVATDDERVAAAVTKFGGEAVMTSPEHQSGTDRLAEVARDLSSDIIVNVQGDEPLIKPEMLDQAIDLLAGESSAVMSTLAAPINFETALNQQRVKVVVDKNHKALYFSRSPIPFYRDRAHNQSPGAAAGYSRPYLQHIGLYAYRREFLLEYTKLDQTALELAESLEQLRALENGYEIMVGITAHPGPGIDVPEDLEKARQLIQQGGSN